MKQIQPVRVTMRNGDIKHFETDIYNLPSVLGKLNMIDVAGIEYGEAIIDKGPAEVRLSDITAVFRPTEGVQYVDIYDKKDQRIAFVKTDSIKLQQFAVNLLQQTTYRFTDVSREHEEMKFRLDGLDK